jgi:putative membrane protein
LRHSTKADKFFTREEKNRILRITADVESKTTGEIVVAVVDRSSRYRETEVLGGVILGSIVSLIATVIFFHASLWSFIPLAFIFFFPCRLLIRKTPALKASLVDAGRKSVAVRERALGTFYEKGLYKTKDNTGILFFLSLLERKVWVLADKGIHGKIHQSTLNKYASMVSLGIKEGRACEALCEAVEGIGKLLAEHYPAEGGGPDELSDDLILGPGARE